MLADIRIFASFPRLPRLGGVLAVELSNSNLRSNLTFADARVGDFLAWRWWRRDCLIQVGIDRRHAVALVEEGIEVEVVQWVAAVHLATSALLPEALRGDVGWSSFVRRIPRGAAVLPVDRQSPSPTQPAFSCRRAAGCCAAHRSMVQSDVQTHPPSAFMEIQAELLSARYPTTSTSCCCV